MKILYVGSNRGDAVTVAAGLRGLAADAAVVWTPRLDRAATWIAQNADVAALVVEAPVDRESWLAVVEHVRRLASRPAIVGILPENATSGFDAPGAPPDEVVAKSPSWLRDLPVAVGRAIERAAAREHTEHTPKPAESAPRVEAAADRTAVERHAEIQALLEQERAARADLEGKLSAATSALAEADDRHRLAAAAAAEQLARLEHRHEISELRAAATRDMLDEQLRKAVIEVERARQEHASATARVDELSRRESELSLLVASATAARLDLERRAADDADQFAARQRDLEARIAEETDRRTRSDASLAQATGDVERLTQGAADLMSRVADVEAERDSLERRLADITRALDQSTGRENELESRIEDERAAGAALQQAITDADAALRIAEERHKTASAASAAAMAERQAEFDRELTETAAVRDSLAQRLANAEASLEQLREDHQAATAGVERLTQREAGLASQLDGLRTVRETLEHRLIDATQAIQAANDRAAHDQAVAAERQADLEGRLAQAHEESDALRTQAKEQAACFETRLADERQAYEARLAETHDWSRRLLLESDALRQTLHATEQRADGLDAELGRTREQLAQVQAAAQADTDRLTGERLEIDRELSDARRSFEDAFERLSNEHDSAVAALAVAVSERDTQLLAQEARVEELQGALTTVRETLEAARRRQNVLQAEADQVPQLRRQLEGSRAECDRLFQQAPLAMFRCTRDGTLTQTNRAWASLTYRKLDELRGPRFAAAVFESPNDLSGLIEQCLSTKSKESIETTLRRKDGARLFVRLSAFAAPAGVIEIAAEDLTRVRVLHDRLDQARRMEAVGRLSSEVALNCAALVSDVHQKAQRWLSAVDAIAPRQEGEMLLEDLRRAGASLQQLVAYADRKTRTSSLLDLNTVVRDLAPVLQQVAGDDVQLQLQESSSPLSVDIETEQIERLLVNLAAHGRDRLLSGGKLAIDVGAVMVDLRFTARHPNVRPGPHALITVREMRRPPRADGVLLSADGSIADRPPDRGGRKLGIDLGALQRLVGGCGGHLWMRVLPQGDIVAKVRLPLVTAYDQPQSRALAALGERGRLITRWFQRS